MTGVVQAPGAPARVNTAGGTGGEKCNIKAAIVACAGNRNFLIAVRCWSTAGGEHNRLSACICKISTGRKNDAIDLFGGQAISAWCSHCYLYLCRIGIIHSYTADIAAG